MPATQYDPTSASPYQAPDLPQVKAPDPSPLPPPQQQQFPIAPTRAGGIAAVADNVMRGFMQGRAMRQERQAKELDNKTKALQASYNLAAKNLQDIVASNNLTQDQVATIMKGGVPQGVDQGVIDSVKTANQAVQGSWQAWTTWLGQHVEQEPGTGKRGNRGKDKGEKLPFLQRLAQGISGKDPAEVSKAIYDYYVKSGPPVYGNLASVTAQAKARAADISAGTAQSEAATATAGLTTNRAKDESRLRELTLKTNPTEEEKAEAERLRNSLAETGPEVGVWKEMRGTINGKPATLLFNSHTREYEKPDHSRAPLEDIENFVPTPKAGHPVRAWSKDANGFYSVLLDPNTNQPIQGSENHNLQPPTSITGSVTSGEMKWTDENGNLHTAPIHTEHRPAAGPAAGGHAAEAPTGSPASPEPKGEGKATTKPAAAPPAKPAGKAGDRVVGYTGSKMYKDLETQVGKVRENYNNTNTALTLMQKSAKAAAQGNGPAMVAMVAGFVKGIIGGAGSGVRVTQTEWNQAVNTAPVLQRIGAHFTDQGIYGVDVKTLSKEQIRDMLLEVKNKQQAVAQELGDVQEQLKSQKAKDTGTTPAPAKSDDEDIDAIVNALNHKKG